MPSQTAALGAPQCRSLTGLYEGLPALRAFFARRVHANDVEDMVQDVAVRLQACTRRDGIANDRAYLFQVARSVMTDRARRDAARRRAAHEPLTEAAHPVEDISPARVLEGRQQLALALEALEALPERARSVFVLHRLERESHAEIARRMGISISAVEKHVMKSMRHLVARLA